MRIVSWNVNGIRAAYKKGLPEFMNEEGAEVICLQETRVVMDQLPRDLISVDLYAPYFSAPQRKGYSGVATYTRPEPIDVWTDMGMERFDREGRLLVTEYEAFILMNVYFPNGKASKERLRYKMDFYEDFRKLAKKLKKRKGVIVCGDVNTAHKEIDIARPKENSNISGFLPEEKAWIDRFLEDGFVDSLRVFDQSPGRYTWWDLRTRARERNVGWRIDYFFVSEGLSGSLTSAGILDQVTGSDHCPIYIELDV
jgi:exodeoxyribonuclease III